MLNLSFPFVDSIVYYKITAASMSSEDIQLPLIDFSGYLTPKSPDDQQKVITQVRDASSRSRATAFPWPFNENC